MAAFAKVRRRHARPRVGFGLTLSQGLMNAGRNVACATTGHLKPSRGGGRAWRWRAGLGWVWGVDGMSWVEKMLKKELTTAKVWTKEGETGIVIWVPI